MEVSSLTVILVAMAIGLIVGFEVGQSVMRKRITEIVENAVKIAQKEKEQKQKETEQRLKRLAQTWTELARSASVEKEKIKEQKENGIQSDAND